MNALASSRRTTTPEALAYAAHFGIAPHLAELLSRLASGSTISALRTHICVLRRAMEAESIDTVRGGYQLTEVGLAECEAARKAFRRWVAA